MTHHGPWVKIYETGSKWRTNSAGKVRGMLAHLVVSNYQLLGKDCVIFAMLQYIELISSFLCHLSKFFWLIYCLANMRIRREQFAQLASQALIKSLFSKTPFSSASSSSFLFSPLALVKWQRLKKGLRERAKCNDTLKISAPLLLRVDKRPHLRFEQIKFHWTASAQF